jgi:hypothetical protein
MPHDRSPRHHLLRHASRGLPPLHVRRGGPRMACGLIPASWCRRSSLFGQAGRLANPCYFTEDT